MLGLAAAGSASADSGKDVYTKVCAVCHAGGIAAAPRFGNAGDWAPRIAKGVPTLYQSALKGTPKGMPAKGGNLTLPDADVKAAVDYMIAAAGGAKAAAAEPKKEAKPEPKKEAKAEAKPEPKKEVAKEEAPKAAPAPAPVAVASAAAEAAPAPTVSAADVNSFNRLLKPASKRNLPPAEDGIHDPSNDGTHALQPPLAAFGSLPKSFAGNRVNWVEAISTGKIKPRYDRVDATAEPIIMDMNVVREVKGSMPDVVYPHKQHTQWLDCSNCHPAIFTPQKGANQISMAAILLGEKCGVCHGKVAFPVSECRLCHSKKKDLAPSAQATAK
ncbi:c-type cytochrome [Azospira restricta]|uniref:C-type cytochrome n=2 Tax=Azospira restricta TaxID=404405 RepID=A0A974Y5Z0_9RHOO|nr:c-type cytochrome [Azospira restricta]